MACPNCENFQNSKVEAPFLARDLEIAREVQKAFVPQELPAIPGLSCEAFYRPAHAIGGDYYDFFPLLGSRWGFAIGDVSGKGIGAALMMASLQATVRAEALHLHPDPSTLINHVNRLVHESSPVHFYASLFYAEYDPGTRLLTYVNAGQNPPIVVRCRGGQSQVFRLQPGNSPVGMFEDPGYNSVVFPLQPGDLLVACTDGIIEAENGEGEPWGQQRLESLFSWCGRQTPRQALKRIVREVSAFAGGMRQDDMALVVMQVRTKGCVRDDAGTG